MKSVFTISLDFELHWGGFEKWELGLRVGANPEAGKQPTVDGRRPMGDYFLPARNYEQYFLNTRKVIPRMLELFDEYDVHVTWATVGMLFHRNKEELMANAPSVKPGYYAENLSAWRYIETVGIGNDEEKDPFHYAPSLIQQILRTPHQEIGTHTFTHYYCNEQGQTVEAFREDLRAARRIASQWRIELRSLVFPRNQFNDDYLRVCFEEGITSVRSNPLDWFWNIQSTQRESAWKRLNRGLDAYFPIGKKNTYSLSDLPVREGLPLCLPASRLLRPYNPRELFLNEFKIRRVQSEMERAAQAGEVYHLWWHPHNFGRFPEQSLHGLKRILHHFRQCRERYGMGSMNMGELAEAGLRLSANTTARNAHSC